MLNRPFFLLGAFLLLMFGLRAQPKETYQTWVDYKHYNKINGQWIFFSDYGVRYSGIDQAAYLRLNARPSIEYVRTTKHSFYGGVGFFYIDYLSGVNTLEIRPWQGYQFKWPSFKRINVVHYFRLEQRFTESLLSESSAFNLKFRYQIGLDVPINNPVISVGTFYVPLSFEFFEDLARSNAQITTNKYRAVAGIGYRISESLRVKVIYTFQGTRSIYDKELQQGDHVLRISFTQNFGFN